MEGEEEKKTEESEEAPPTEEEPPVEEPPPPPPEEPPPPPPEEPPSPITEEPPPPSPPQEPSAVKVPSLQPVSEAPSEVPVTKVPSSQPPVKSASALRSSGPKNPPSEKSAVTLADATGSNKSFVKKPSTVASEKNIAKRNPSRMASDGNPAGGFNMPGLGNFNCSTFLQKRSPFIHNPPQPEERRSRVLNPRTPREYIINLREDLADFQESHGLPRTRDYSFLSLGLALAQETARALCSLFLMFAELFPIVAIVSLIMRFALDKLIEILETNEPVPKVKKSIIFTLEMLVIIIPLWIFIGTIIIPLLSLILSIFKRMIRIKGEDAEQKQGQKHAQHLTI